jgi:hypothetical protein
MVGAVPRISLYVNCFPMHALLTVMWWDKVWIGAEAATAVCPLQAAPQLIVLVLVMICCRYAFSVRPSPQPLQITPTYIKLVILGSSFNSFKTWKGQQRPAL